MASNWQKRARNMLDMLNPSGSKGAAVRADQLRQLHSSGAAVPVNMPEKEELQLVISFWAQWEARSGVSLAQLATPDTGAEVCEQASKLLTEAAASKQQIKLPQRDAVAKLVSRRDWAVRATALLKRAQQQLDDNTAAVAAGIRSSKQKRVAREDFQAL
eukprot:737-Heterococcus_DN1.PRE.1